MRRHAAMNKPPPGMADGGYSGGWREATKVVMLEPLVSLQGPVG